MTVGYVKNIILVCLVFAMNLGCARKAYYYYKIDSIDVHFFNIESQNDWYAEIACCDSISQNTDAYVLIDPKVSFYYKEKNKHYLPAQRGEKCSEEKISSMQITLIGEKLLLEIDTLLGPIDFQTNYVISNSQPGISMVKFANSTRYFLSLDDFTQSFNSCEERVKCDFNINAGIRLLFNNNNIPTGDYFLQIDVIFDSGRKLNLTKKLVIY